MAAKLSKKDLKSPDAFQSTFEQLGDYVLENKTRVTVIASALVCAIILVVGIYFYWSYYSNAALKLYATAQQNLIQSGENKESIEENVGIFNEIIAKYPYSWSGKMAYYHLGNIHFKRGEMDESIAAYKKFVSKTRTDKSGVKFLALTSLGYCYERKADFNEALKYFELAQKTYNVGFEMIGLRNIARMYEALDNKEKALEYYKKALEITTEPAALLFIKRKISTLS
ncbi:MAG: tetratricopeptide repeat protein [Smithellaceae bacterium]